MRTLVLRHGERVTVLDAEWNDAFGVVTHGRVQLELRDGEPGPVLVRDAGFWLRGTGVRALRNPGRRTATVRIDTRPGLGMPATHPVSQPTNDGGTFMNSSKSTGVAAGPTRGRTSSAHQQRGLVATGLIAALVAMAATTLAAALAGAIGVEFEVPDDGERIPLSGIAFVTGVFSVVGIFVAAALLRWSARPAQRFAWTAVSLTAISLVPPLLSGAGATTTAALIGLHLVAAAVMIPTLARSLRRRS